MPVQVDHARPVRTLDVTGNVISTDSNGSAPIKSIDSVGREVKEAARVVANQAAAGNPELPHELPAAETDAKPAEGDKTPTSAEIRKEYLEAQKERRKAFELLKGAKEKVARAEALEKAKALAVSGEDPTALLKAAGLDEVKFYQDMTTYALSDKAKKPEDPVQKELREHKERLDKYAKDLEVQTKTFEEKQHVDACNVVIRDKVVPMLNSNGDKYECLLKEYGANAAVQIFNTAWEIYKSDPQGKAPSFETVADEMEKYWEETIGKGITEAATLKKFQNRFAQNGNGTSQQQDRIETPKRSVTLSNKPSAPAPLGNFAPKKRAMTRDERVAEILRKFPD